MANTLQIRTTKDFIEELNYLVKVNQDMINFAVESANENATGKKIKPARITKSDIIRALVLKEYNRIVEEENKAIDEYQKEQEEYLNWLEREGYMI